MGKNKIKGRKWSCLWGVSGELLNPTGQASGGCSFRSPWAETHSKSASEPCTSERLVPCGNRARAHEAGAWAGAEWAARWLVSAEQSTEGKWLEKMQQLWAGAWDRSWCSHKQDFGFYLWEKESCWSISDTEVTWPGWEWETGQCRQRWNLGEEWESCLSRKERWRFKTGWQLPRGWEMVVLWLPFKGQESNC